MSTLTARLRQAGRLVLFALWYLRAWLRANLEVLVEIVTPGTRISAAFVELPLRCRTELEITMISNLISLTPGTVTVSTRKDPPTIWVHGIFVDDVGSARADLYEMEGRMLTAMRVDPDPGPVPPLRRGLRASGTGRAPGASGGAGRTDEGGAR